MGVIGSLGYFFQNLFRGVPMLMFLVLFLSIVLIFGFGFHLPILYVLALVSLAGFLGGTGIQAVTESGGYGNLYGIGKNITYAALLALLLGVGISVASSAGYFTIYQVSAGNFNSATNLCQCWTSSGPAADRIGASCDLNFKNPSSPQYGGYMCTDFCKHQITNRMTAQDHTDCELQTEICEEVWQCASNGKDWLLVDCNNKVQATRTPEEYMTHTECTDWKCNPSSGMIGYWICPSGAGEPGSCASTNNYCSSQKPCCRADDMCVNTEIRSDGSYVYYVQDSDLMTLVYSDTTWVPTETIANGKCLRKGSELVYADGTSAGQTIKEASEELCEICKQKEGYILECGEHTGFACIYLEPSEVPNPPEAVQMTAETPADTGMSKVNYYLLAAAAILIVTALYLVLSGKKRGRKR